MLDKPQKTPVENLTSDSSVVATQDISEKNREELLQESEARYRDACRIAKLGHWEYDEVEDKLISCSEELARIHGMSPEDYLAMFANTDKDIKRIHPDDWKTYGKVLRDAQTGATPFSIEYRIIQPNGEVRHVREIGEPICDKTGRLIRSHGTLQDITELKQTEKTLSERDVHIGQAFSMANIGTWIWGDVNNEYDYISPEFAKIFGYDVDHLLTLSKENDSYLLCVHPDDEDLVVQATEESFLRQKPYNVTYRILRSDGAVRTVREVSQPIIDHQEVVIGSIGCTQDISDILETQNQLHKSQLNYQWAAEIGKIGHYEWDEVLNQCDYCSLELANLYGITADQYIEISKKHDMNSELIHPDDQEMYARMTSNYDQDLDVVFRKIREDGSIAYFREYGRRIRDNEGKVIRTNGIIQDITKQKNTEEALNIALVDAERANQAKSEFLATMSHEFRTPLNAIIGFSEMMRAKYFGPLGSSNYEEYAEDIHQSGEHMLSLVNGVLDIAAIEAGKREYFKEDCKINDLIANCIRSVDKVAIDACLKLTSDIPSNLPALYADERSIKQIILNLLSNSIKFSHPNGIINVSVYSMDQDICISISDTGIGIPADRISDITKPFSQINSEAFIAEEGTGLGLSIVESLVLEHNGKLNIESKLGKGTTVVVKFPF